MILDRLIEIDQNATLWLNGLNNPALDQFWIFMSDKLVWVPAYLILLFLIIRRLGWRRALPVIFSVILTIVICDQVSLHVKNGIERLRPMFNAEMLRGGLHYPSNRYGDIYGFFSGHASNSFGLIASLLVGFSNDRSHNYSGFAFFGYLWAALVSVSRVMIGRHYLGDILVGTLFGLFVGYSVGLLTKYLINKYLPASREEA